MFLFSLLLICNVFCDTSGHKCAVLLYDSCDKPEVSTAGCRVVWKDRRFNFYKLKLN